MAKRSCLLFRFAGRSFSYVDYIVFPMRMKFLSAELEKQIVELIKLILFS